MMPRGHGNSAQDVYHGLREDILSGEYPPGTALVEEAIAAKFAVSRTPVRPALLLLAQDGLAVIPSHGGAIVRAVTVRDITEIFELRQAIESFALGHLTSRLDRTALTKLAQAYREQVPGETSAAEGPEVLLYSTETELHHLILEGWGNERAIRTLTSHSQQLGRVRALLWRAADPLIDSEMAIRNRQAHEEHKDIIEHILGGDIEAAQGALDSHLRSGRDSLIRLMASTDLETANRRKPRGKPALTNADFVR